MEHFLALFLAFVYGNLMEYVLHKYILHGIGKKKNNPFNFHWRTHHKACRKNNFYDSAYENPDSFFRCKEKLSLFLLMILHIPTYFISPTFFVGISVYTVYYYKLHQWMHINVEAGRKRFPWHYDHHMGKDQDKNWGVTHQWIDKLLGSRKTYD